MLRAACIILGLAFLSLGTITGMVAVFKPNQFYLNAGEMILGILGLAVGLFSTPDAMTLSTKPEHMLNEFSKIKL